MSTRLDRRAALLVAMMLFALILFGRLLPHPPNFTPVAAAALFAGAILPRRLALSIPFAAMVVSDLVIGLHPLVLVTWSSFAVFAILSSYIFKKITPTRVIASSFAASILFFLISNFGVWVEGRLYAHTLSGLAMSYWNGLPFLRYTVMGDLLFAVLLFGTYALATQGARQLGRKSGYENVKI